MTACSDPSPSRSLAVASTNSGKLQELRELLAAHNINVVGQSELGIASIPETGLTFVENALLKARHMAAQMATAAAAHGQVPVLADDSGLVVPALGGAPGLYSSRYDGPGATDSDNNRRLLETMRDLRDDERRAWFHCTLVCLHHAADPDPLIVVARWDGRIAERASGDHGFGYDPVFMPAGERCSAAAMPPSRKRRLSHRGQALQQLLASLPRWW